MTGFWSGWWVSHSANVSGHLQNDERRGVDSRV